MGGHESLVRFQRVADAANTMSRGRRSDLNVGFCWRTVRHGRLVPKETLFLQTIELLEERGSRSNSKVSDYVWR